MTIALGGVEFTVKANMGRSVNQLNRLKTGLTDVATAATAAKAALGDSASLLTAVATGHQKAGQSASTHARETRNLADESVSLSEAAGMVVKSFSALKLGSFIKEITLLAARVENLDTVMRNEGEVANYTAGELSLTEQKVKSLGITTQVTREIMARFAQNHLDVAEASKVARIAQDAAVVAGINSSQAAERLAVAIQRLDTRMLRNLGILVNLRQEYQKYGLATGRVETSLSAMEKQQIVLNAVQRAGVRMQGNYVKSLEDVYKQFTTLDRKIEETQVLLGSNFIPAFEAGVKAVDSFLNWSQKAGPTIQVLTTIGLATGAATTAVVAMSAAYRVLTPLIFANTVAANANTAATVAGTVAARGFVSAIAASAGPIGLAVIGITALVAAYSALEWQRRKFFEQQKEDIKIRNSRSEQVRKLMEEIEHLEAEENKSADTQQRLNEKIRAVRELLPDTTKKFEGMALSVRELTAAVKESTEVDLTPLVLKIEQAEKKIKEAEERLRAFEEGPKLPAGSAGEVFARTAQLQALRRNLEMARINLISLEEERDIPLLREAEERLLKAETAAQLATRALRRAQDARVSAVKDANASIIDSMNDYMRTLAADFETESQIWERYNLRVRKSEAETNRIIQDSTKTREQRSDAMIRHNELVAEFASQRDAEIKQNRDIVSAYAGIFEITDKRLAVGRAEIEALQEQIDAAKDGFDSDILDVQQKLAKSRRELAEATEFYRQELERLSELEASIAESMKSETDEIAKQQQQNQLDILRKQIERTKEAESQVRQRALLEEQRLQTELYDKAHKAIQKNIDLIMDYMNRVREMENSIKNLGREYLLGPLAKRNPILARLMELSRARDEFVAKFRDQISKAATPEQVEKLQDLFNKVMDPSLRQSARRDAMKQLLHEFSNQGMNEFRERAQEEIANAAEQRKAQLAVEQQQLQIAVDQLGIQKQILEAIMAQGLASSELHKAQMGLINVQQGIINKSFGKDQDSGSGPGVSFGPGGKIQQFGGGSSKGGGKSKSGGQITYGAGGKTEFFPQNVVSIQDIMQQIAAEKAAELDGPADALMPDNLTLVDAILDEFGNPFMTKSEFEASKNSDFPSDLFSDAGKVSDLLESGPRDALDQAVLEFVKTLKSKDGSPAQTTPSAAEQSAEASPVVENAKRAAEQAMKDLSLIESIRSEVSKTLWNGLLTPTEEAPAEDSTRWLERDQIDYGRELDPLRGDIFRDVQKTLEREVESAGAGNAGSFRFDPNRIFEGSDSPFASGIGQSLVSGAAGMSGTTQAVQKLSGSIERFAEAVSTEMETQRGILEGTSEKLDSVAEQISRDKATARNSLRSNGLYG